MTRYPSRVSTQLCDEWVQFAPDVSLFLRADNKDLIIVDMYICTCLQLLPGLDSTSTLPNEESLLSPNEQCVKEIS